jgi:prepilin-type N-terminal cleavage/methylation domain-containing protein
MGYDTFRVLNRGYTFIELCVVMALLGLLTALALPKFSTALFTDDLGTGIRKLTGTIQALKHEAARERTDIRLRLNLETGRVWIDAPLAERDDGQRRQVTGFHLPEGTHIMDVQSLGAGKMSSGETVIRIDRRGYVQPSVIHLGSDGGDVYTLFLSPFLERVAIAAGYVSFEGIHGSRQ